jgi:hypothetical protein
MKLSAIIFSLLLGAAALSATPENKGPTIIKGALAFSDSHCNGFSGPVVCPAIMGELRVPGIRGFLESQSCSSFDEGSDSSSSGSVFLE